MDDADRAQAHNEQLEAAALSNIAARGNTTANSLSECIECGGEIPLARQIAVQGVTHCIECAQFFEMQNRGRR